MTVKQLVKAVHKLDRTRRCLVEDPMTEAMGAPVEDFMEDYDKQERHLLCEIMKQSHRGSWAWEWAASRLERWMP